MEKNIKLLKSHEEAVKDEAFNELKKRGFIFDASENDFQGEINGNGYGYFPIKVKIPENFPNAVPQVFVERKSLGKRIPHVEENGKLCIVPNTGILLDSNKPKELIIESIERASKLIQDGLSEKNKEDFLTEYQAYWTGEASIKSVCDPDKGSREVELITLSKDDQDGLFLFDDYSSARNWAAKINHKIINREKAFLINLTEAFYPPDYNKPVLQSEIFDLIKSFTSLSEYRRLNSWLQKNRLPAVIVISLPLNSREQVFIGMMVKALTGKLKDKSQNGFYPGMGPVWRELLLGHKNPVTKISINRLDSSYLLKRGGGNNSLLDKTVAIIGCGAIGSHLVMKLASLGIGNLRLVDSENFKAENLHRHVLGMTDIDKNKALCLTKLLNQNYPHLNVQHKENLIEEVMKKEPDFILDSDLVLIALGDETLELSLNDSLPQNLKRLHVWVEPLSIGGHLLLTGLKNVGCFRCLFGNDSIFGIYNQAAFAAAGQNFQRSYSGCAGVFTPFSAVDADKAANEAATIAARVLLDKEESNMLISWRGYEDDFINEGYKFSSRGKIFSTNERRIETNFVNPICSTCGIRI